MNSQYVTLIVSFVTDFIITAGTGVAGAMAATKVVEIPNRAVVALAVLMGIVSAARRVQALLAPPALKP